MSAWWTSWERYKQEEQREERNFAHGHNYAEWVQQQLWEAGEATARVELYYCCLHPDECGSER